MQKSIPAVRRIVFTSIASSLLVLGGCVTAGSHTVPAGAMRTAAAIEPVTVISVRPVTITPNNTGIGAATGATVGGLLGSRAGNRRSTRALAGIGGAIVGGLAGNAVEQAAGTRQGYAYVVEFGDGTRSEIIQDDRVYIAPGSPANVVYRADGALVSPVI